MVQFLCVEGFGFGSDRLNCCSIRYSIFFGLVLFGT